MMTNSFALAAFMPFLFAIIASIITWKAISHRMLFFIVVLCLFFFLQDNARFPFESLYPDRAKTAEEQVSNDTAVRFMADGVSAILGFLFVWQLRARFKKNIN